MENEEIVAPEATPATTVVDPVAEENKDLTEEELLEKAQAISQRKRDEFAREYNALCDKYNLVIEPSIQLQVKPKAS